MTVQQAIEAIFAPAGDFAGNLNKHSNKQTYIRSVKINVIELKYLIFSVEAKSNRTVNNFFS